MCIGSYADISVHAPTRGATSNSLSFSIFSVFQSTLPREERLLGLNFKEANSIFQSTLPREERLLQQYLSHFQLLFQSTLPREKRRNYATTGDIPTKFQSTLPREERPLQHQLGLHRRIFQSTLPREERRAKRTCLPKEPSDFNPRSHERSDPQPTPLVCPPTFISIHAPTRGATQGVIDLHSGLYDFNPRSHERSDKEHGVIEADQENFNPRSHERSDDLHCFYG